MQVFFYGLFMDPAVLAMKGIIASNPRKCRLEHYALRIGRRASLAPCMDETVYGVTVEITEKDTAKLYSEKSVADYIPETVNVITETNEQLPATCYILPREFIAGTNVPYARSLYELARKMDFPTEYSDKIRKAALQPGE